jgi:hypothetical protein
MGLLFLDGDGIPEVEPSQDRGPETGETVLLLVPLTLLLDCGKGSRHPQMAGGRLAEELALIVEP